MSVSSCLRLSPLALALLALPLATPAQTIPNSGQILQQVQPAPSEKPQAEPGLVIESPASSTTADSTPFAVARLQIDGNGAFDTATLHALVADGEGRSLTLTGLNALAQRITDYYRAHGYPLARALVPAQTLSNGTVHITVVEARYDQVQLDNRSRVGDGLLRATLAPLQAGQPVTQSALDRSLLLLGELPGVSPHATLSPGTDAGTSTLGVMADVAPALQGNLLVDDAGSRYTGRLRVGANLDINNPLHHGDQLNLSALTAGHGMRYGRLGYQYTLNGQGTRLGAAYSALTYALGGPLDALDAHGAARVASAWLTQPLVRTRGSRLDVRLQFDRKQLRDRIDTTALRNDRHSNHWAAEAYGQHSDDLAGGGLTNASLSLGHGQLGFDRGAAAAAAADAATARTQGSYTHWNASLARLQSLGSSTRLYASVSGQHSNRNLDSSEQFLLGGPNSVRGYDVASVAGASGWLGTLELRHDLDWGCAGHCEGSVFADHGSLRINADSWTSGPNRAHLSSAGVGFNWVGTRQWQAQVQLAVPMGAAPALLGKRSSARVWLQVLKGF
ncbi:peptide transporter [Rhodanobacter sp. Soil772]|uniref:ShlB/FhaC/HecB family hemolysin secretion/activation protein n=1 Tax=Rhodanobacter sp. Soil772 TaxID=1736406 RepID=UPI0006F73597|nr:ShlB/FhaC/HecB family hemolysin secretion/activation protein [Rhodanobacter sp. Soil772]KRE82895.1 peptide transporter [Rhodanobacter sp. Soil772]